MGNDVMILWFVFVLCKWGSRSVCLLCFVYRLLLQFWNTKFWKYTLYVWGKRFRVLYYDGFWFPSIVWGQYETSAILAGCEIYLIAWYIEDRFRSLWECGQIKIMNIMNFESIGIIRYIKLWVRKILLTCFEELIFLSCFPRCILEIFQRNWGPAHVTVVPIYAFFRSKLDSFPTLYYIKLIEIFFFTTWSWYFIE